MKNGKGKREESYIPILENIEKVDFFHYCFITESYLTFSLYVRCQKCLVRINNLRTFYVFYMECHSTAFSPLHTHASISK